MYREGDTYYIYSIYIYWIVLQYIYTPATEPTIHLSLDSSEVYSEEAPDLKTTYLSERHPPKSMYAETVSLLTTPQEGAAVEL